ncbi:MAG: RNB domain-containing ribonuclease [Neisseria sp.]|nr:RNB domain-containing ribonuclease [Neisseria sp.]
MNIFYEESGQFKVAAVVQKNDATYQADTLHGKRAKIKAGNVFVEFDGDAAQFLQRAQDLAAEIDIDLVWEAAGGEEFDADGMTAEYFQTAGKTETAAMLITLYGAPAYFHKKNKGVFKPAPAEVLQQALAAIERKKQQEAQQEAWIAELKQGIMPSEIAAELKTILHAPDKQSLCYKAYTKAAAELKTTPYDLARQTGAVASLPQFLLDGFEIKNYPRGAETAELPLPELTELPLNDIVRAFSIDDESTTEVDDALSVQHLADGITRIGIHIAAPSLPADAAVEKVIAQRQSTAYFPGGKITMLPQNWIGAFSLDKGEARPAVSIYFDINEQFEVEMKETRAERITVAENLRIQQIEPFFRQPEDLNNGGQAAFPFHNEMVWLHRLAIELQKQRGKYEADRAPQYDYGIEFTAEGKVAVSQRERGSPIDTVVSEMMILANSRWAEMLNNSGTAGLFRVQPVGKVRMSTHSEPHIGMGVQHYGWFTSPLRRAADYINQQQLLSLADGREPRFRNNDAALFAALRDFESAYAAYNDFQREMESYWSLVYIEQEQLRELSGTFLKDDLVRINGLPLAVRATGIPFDLPPKTTVRLSISEVDSEKRFIALNYLGAVV